MRPSAVHSWNRTSHTSSGATHWTGALTGPLPERTSLLNQGVELRARSASRLSSEPAAGMADVDQVGPLVDPQHDRAEMLRSRAAR